MKVRVVVAACAALCGCFSSLAANTWYVDAANDGQAGLDGSPEHAFGTIQQAIDATTTLKGDTILVRPGVYTNGVTVVDDNGRKARVYISKSLTIKSTDGKEVTHIVGAPDPDDREFGQGPDAVGCIYNSSSKNNAIVLDGFTIRDGHSDGVMGAAVLGQKNTSIHLVDCVVSNCFSSNGNVYYATLHRCLLAENETTSSSSSPAAYGCFLSNCLVVRNGGRSPGAVNAVVYSKIVNCSIVGNVGRPASCNNYDNAAWNCAFALNEASDVPSKYGMTNSVSTASESSFAMSYASIGDVPSTNFFFAPLFDDYRPLPGSPLVGHGDARWLDEVIALPEGYVHRDYLGNELPSSGPITVGAIQTVAPQPAGGCYAVGDTESLTDGHRAVTTKGVYAWPSAWPTQWCVTAVSPETAPLSCVQDSLLGFRRFSGYDGCVWMTPPPPGTNKLATAECAHDFMYVDDGHGNDAWDGSSATHVDGTDIGPKQTLQAAVDVLDTSRRTMLYVAPGTYDKGVGSGGGIYSNRVSISSNKRRIHFIAPGGPEKTFIVGASDSTSPAEADGCGTLGLRCVFNYSEYTGFRGFTFTGGRSSNGAVGGKNYPRYGAVWYADLPGAITDSIISNNVAEYTTIYNRLLLERCRIEGNRSLGDALLGNTVRAVACVFRDNVLAAGKPVLANGCSVSGCTFAGLPEGACLATSDKTIIANSIVADGGTAPFKNGVTLAGCLMDRTTVNVTADGYVNGHAFFVNRAAGDVRIANGSQALGLGTSDVPDFALYAGSDLNGDPICRDGSAFAAGAYSKTTPGFAMVVIEAERGEILVEGGVLGENTLAPGGSVTVRLDPAAARPCVGVSVNGEFRAFDADGKVTMTYEEAVDGVFMRAVYADTWYVDAEGGDDGNTGFTAATAKKTLSVALGLAQSGDTVSVAEGVYSNGTGTVTKSSVTYVMRAAVPEGVTLRASGAVERTVILGEGSSSGDAEGRGPGAVSGVYALANARVEGFTITGGRSVASDGDAGYAGGVYGANYDKTVFANCIISNNASGAQVCGYAAFVNCRIEDNRVSTAGILRNSAVYGCLLARNVAKQNPMLYCLTFENSTFAADNVNLSGESYSNRLAFMQGAAERTIVNSIVFGRVEKLTRVTNCVFPTGALPDDISSKVNTLEVAPDEMLLTDDYRPALGRCVAVDAGDVSLVDTELCGTNDLAGIQRVMNGRMDCGCYEADWRPRYGKDLGPKATVESVTPGVRETDAKTVGLRGGDALTLTLPAAGEQEKTYEVAFKVIGTGTLTVSRDGGASETYAASPNVRNLLFTASGDEVQRLTFAYEAGAGDDGGAEIVSARILSGMLLIVR